MITAITCGLSRRVQPGQKGTVPQKRAGRINLRPQYFPFPYSFLFLPILAVGLKLYDEDNQPAEIPEKIQWIDEAEEKIRGKKILLVDEVDESRATLAYCTRELLKHGP